MRTRGDVMLLRLADRGILLIVNQWMVLFEGLVVSKNTSHYLPLLEDNRRALPPLLKPEKLLHSVEQNGKEMKLRHPHMIELFRLVFLPMIPPLKSQHTMPMDSSSHEGYYYPTGGLPQMGGTIDGGTMTHSQGIQ